MQFSRVKKKKEKEEPCTLISAFFAFLENEVTPVRSKKKNKKTHTTNK